MPKKDKLKINIILNLLYEILVIAAPMITAPYVSRVLQADGIGKYSYTSSLLAYFTMFASLGTASYGQREIARLRGDKKRYSKIFWEIELCSVFTTCICLILWLLFAIMYDEYRTYMLAITYSLVAVLFDISWLYRGLEKFKYTVGINAFFKILSIILIFTLVKTENDLVRYMVIMSLGTLFGNVSMWLFLKREVVITRIELKALKSHLKTALVYFGPTIATSIYTVLDKTLIGVITQSNVENGYYEQATKIMNIVKSVSYSAINGVMASRACFLYSKKERNELDDLIDNAYHLTTFMTVGACFGLIAISDIFVPLFFGKGYEPVIGLLNLMSPLAVVIGISSTAGAVYYGPAGDMKNATKYLLCGSVSNLALNLCLIPRFGSYGAVVSSIIAEVLVTFLFVSFSKGYITWEMICGYLDRKVVSGVIMLLAIRLINDKASGLKEHWLLIMDIFWGAIIYLVVLVILKDESVERFRELIRSKRMHG